MIKFIVTVKTMCEKKHIQVKAKSSAEALLKLADRIPLHGAVVIVSPR